MGLAFQNRQAVQFHSLREKYDLHQMFWGGNGAKSTDYEEITIKDGKYLICILVDRGLWIRVQMRYLPSFPVISS